MADKALEIIDLLDELRTNNLYVHNTVIEGVKFNQQILKDRPVFLVETLATLNALVKNGTMILYGGHGGGKTTLCKILGQMFLSKTESEVDEAILRGHKELTEEKILGSLNPEQLLGHKKIIDGKWDVRWNDFVTTQWKIIDEVNRLSPGAQNILLSLLAEGVVKYQNRSYSVGNFTLFATMNPSDVGTTDIPMPFMDRFALALPITMPDYFSMQTLGKKDKLTNRTLIDFKLEKNDLNKIQDLIQDSIEYEPEAEEFINNIIADYRLCVRLTKEASEDLTVDNGLCTKGGECHYFVPGQVCHKIINPLSVRVKEDLYRYGRAFTWLLGYDKVTSLHIKTIAPYLIWHRSDLSKRFLEENIKSKFEETEFFVNSKLEGAKAIIDQIFSRFNKRYVDFIKPFNDALKGDLKKSDLEALINISSENKVDDLLIGSDEFLGKLQEIEACYDKMLSYQNKINEIENITELNTIKSQLKREYKIPNYQILSNKIENKIKRITAKKYPQIKIEIKTDDNTKILNSDVLNPLFSQVYGDDVDFSLSIATKSTLSKSSDEFILEAKPTRVKLICYYRGPENEIKKELLKIGKETV